MTKSNFLLKEEKVALCYLIPTLLFLLIFVLYPFLYTLFLSFHKVNFTSTGMNLKFAGLKNYLRLFTDPKIPLIFKQTIIFMVLRVGGTFLIGLSIAIIVFSMNKGKNLFKIIFLIPWTLSNVTNALIWQWMYNSQFGIFNEILLRLGLIDKYIAWLTSPQYALYAIIFADIWKTCPFVCLMFFAALQTVPSSLKEAARVDGANSFQIFLHITLQCIKPVILVVLIIQTMWAIKAFDLIWVFTQGGPLDRTTILTVYAYKQSFQYFKMDYGSAIAYAISFILLFFTFLYFKSIRIED